MHRDYMEVITYKHNHARSSSDIGKKQIGEDNLFDTFKVSFPMKLKVSEMKNNAEVKEQHPTSEIVQLQKKLDEQFMVREALEKPKNHRWSSSQDLDDVSSVAKPAEDLIREISLLEMEVKFLEKHLLSLYRKRFDQSSPSLPKEDERSEQYSTQGSAFSTEAGHDITFKKENSVIHSSHFLPPQNLHGHRTQKCSDILGAQTLQDSSIHRSHSSLSQNYSAAYPLRTSPSGVLTETLNSFHSLPLSMLERAQVATSNGGLAAHVGTRVPDCVPETANRLSEEMVKCISAIYCQLSDPPLCNHDVHFSPISFASSTSETSPHFQHDSYSQDCRKISSLNSLPQNPFHIEGHEEFGRSYFTMFEVRNIRRDPQILTANENFSQAFRTLVEQLQQVDPRKMKREEKLAFWINVHNALVMHAILVHGIPRSNLRRISLVLKAAYNIGGQNVSVDTIQSSILGCRLPRPGHWFQSLLFPKAKFKPGDLRKSYAIEHPEPLLQFAISTGSHSDPVVRVYTPKRVYQDLEMAKEEYIETNIRIHKEHKIILPKVVESFAKDMKMCPAELKEMIRHALPDTLRKGIAQQQQGKLLKRIEWIPHNFSFRYLLSYDLVN